MSVLKVGVIHVSFQGTLNTTCDYMKVISQGFKSRPIVIHSPGMYRLQVMPICSPCAAVNPLVKQVALCFANTSLLHTKHLFDLISPQNKEPDDWWMSIAPLHAVHLSPLQGASSRVSRTDETQAVKRELI